MAAQLISSMVIKEVGEIATKVVGEKITDGLNVLFGKTTAFKDKTRPMIVTVINDTPNVYKLKDIHFESGKAYHHEAVGSTLSQGVAHVFYVCNVDGGIMTGVSGWIQYVDEAKNVNLGIGFSNPYAGGLKTKAKLGDTGENVYNEMENTTGPGIFLSDLDGIPSTSVCLSLIV